MKQLFVVLGTACLLVGAGLVVPGPAHAVPPFDCPVVFTGAFGGNSSLTIYQIDEITGPLVTLEGNRCFIESRAFGTTPVHIDILKQGQSRTNPTGSNPVSDYIDLVFEPNTN